MTSGGGGGGRKRKRTKTKSDSQCKRISGHMTFTRGLAATSKQLFVTFSSTYFEMEWMVVCVVEEELCECYA